MRGGKLSISLGCLTLAGLVLGAAGSPAKAQVYTYHYAPAPVYVAPAPVYCPPPVVYAPPPVVYAPPAVVYHRPAYRTYGHVYVGGHRHHYHRHRGFSFGFGWSR